MYLNQSPSVIFSKSTFSTFLLLLVSCSSFSSSLHPPSDVSTPASSHLLSFSSCKFSVSPSSLTLQFKSSSPTTALFLDSISTCSALSSSLSLVSLQHISSVKCSTSSLETANQAASRPNVVAILEERGLLESVTSEILRSACSDPNVAPLKVYCGFDRTAERLHLGNLLGIIVLSWFQRCGHQAVGLIGGATGRVGDPIW